MLVAFKILSAIYPVLYSRRELEHLGVGEHSAAWAETLKNVTSLWHQLSLACFLKEEHVLEVQGLDAWMHLQFQWLALRILALLALVPLAVCPLHWTHGGSREVFSRLNLAVSEDRSYVLWLHVAVVWGVIMLTTRQLQMAMKTFVPVRYRFLSAMRFPQATTVLVEGLPDSLCSDLRLHSYFSNLFGENAVVRCYVVRNAKLLSKKLDRLRKAQRALERATRSEGEASPSSPMVQFRLEALKDITEEVAAERIRLGRLSHALDPDVCTSTGFVTFSTRLDMRLAAREQLGTESFALQLQAAPDVEDVNYESLLVRPSFTQQRLGYLSVFSVFVAFLPAVVFLSTLMSLKSWEQIFPVIQRWRRVVPIVMEMLEGVLATLSLKLMLAFIPAILLKLVRSFWKPVSKSSAQLQLQKTYFAFLVIFVLLVTSFAQGLITTLLYVAQQPTAIIPLLAKSLPLTSRFYVNYIVLGWVSCFCELLRPAPLVMYLSLHEFFSEQDALARAEEDSVMMGTRVARSTFMLVIALVFCSICPLVLLVAAVYFLVERLSHGYLMLSAEPRAGDSGGELFVQALKQIHTGLLIYVLLMIGVLSPRGWQFGVLLTPNLFLVMWSVLSLDSYLWPCLPLDQVMNLDDNDPCSEHRAELVYEQLECREEQRVPQIVVSRASLATSTAAPTAPAASAAPPPPAAPAARAAPAAEPATTPVPPSRGASSKPPEETGTSVQEEEEEYEF
ncbi:unnamed protein product [Durusdinium trenchii]|uniref:CSC1-like protein At4g02900 n=3 Tax=Durusdinium trenchii TaxID=1381693 RepID=A0ABP0Q5F8_9DINO